MNSLPVLTTVVLSAKVTATILAMIQPNMVLTELRVAVVGNVTWVTLHADIDANIDAHIDANAYTCAGALVSMGPMEVLVDAELCERCCRDLR